MLLGFKVQFEPKIRSRVKRHTIRGKRKHPPKVGDICHCYVGLRQKGARLLGRWLCVKVQDIEILPQGILAPAVLIDGIRLSLDECQALSESDGFSDFAEMWQFWQGRLPFHGDMIHWNPDAPLPQKKPKRRRKAAVIG